MSSKEFGCNAFWVKFPFFLSQEPGKVVSILSRIQGVEFKPVQSGSPKQRTSKPQLLMHMLPQRSLVTCISLRPLQSTLLQMYLESLCWDGGCSAVITCITEKSQKIINWLGYKVWGERYCLCMKTVWRVICITVPDHSELPVFILQYEVLCSLHQGDKTRLTWQNNTHLFHYQLLHRFLSLTTRCIFGCLNYLCEYHLL